LLHKMNTGRGTSRELQEWSKQIAALFSTIDQKTDRWLELSEIMEAKA
jgi:hypothetical protein